MINRVFTRKEEGFVGKDIQDYLDKGIKGAPELKPHEKKRYLGEFEERILLAIQNKEMTSTAAQKHAEEVILAQPGHALKINSSAPTKARTAFIKIAQKHNVPFTIIQTDQNELDAIGVVYVADTAVNYPDFLYQPSQTTTTSYLNQKENHTTKTTSFFERFK